MTAPVTYTKQEMLKEGTNGRCIECERSITLGDDGVWRTADTGIAVCDDMGDILPAHEPIGARQKAMLRQAAAEGQGNEAALAHERNNTAYWQSQAEALARRVAAFRAEFFYGATGGRVEQEMFAALKRHHLDRVTPEDPTFAATPTEPTPPPSVGRCKTCQHWAKNHPTPGWRIGTSCFAKGMYRGNQPADGSGFCHRYEATK